MARSVVVTLLANPNRGGTYRRDVYCNKGELAVAGGYQSSGTVFVSDNTMAISNTVAFTSMPLVDGASPSDGTTPTGWRFGLFRNDQTVAENIILYVLCAAGT